MAIATYTLENSENNKIVLTNTSTTLALTYTIHKLLDTGLFTPVTSYSLFPATILAPGGVLTLDLMYDNVYKIIFDDTVDVEVLFLLDYNIKICERDLEQKILCDSCDPCDISGFDTKVLDLLRFKVIKENIYYIWNKWVQTQSITDLLVANNADILSIGDWKTKLITVCGACTDNPCGKSLVDPDTGCSGCK